MSEKSTFPGPPQSSLKRQQLRSIFQQVYEEISILISNLSQKRNFHELHVKWREGLRNDGMSETKADELIHFVCKHFI